MADRNTDKRNGNDLYLGVAASTKVEAGHMGAVNAAGYVVPASDTAGLKVIGRIENTVDNTTGGNGGESVAILRNQAFHWANSATTPLTVADIGGNAYVEDSVTVTTDVGSTNNIVAGKILEINSKGVWVDAR